MSASGRQGILIGMKDEISLLSIAEASRLLDSGATCSRELTELELERIGRLNPALRAFALVDAEGALSAAEASDRRRERGESLGMLDGIPLSVKDNYETAGLLTRVGSPRYGTHVPSRDAEMVSRLKAAGAVMLGKTSLPPLAMDSQTSSPISGLTRNPWDLEVTPGGSSGGGAAAVASDLSYADLCNDLLGSIRLPAHYCGLVGFMPSEACLPLSGILPRPKGVRPWAAAAMRLLRPGFLARSLEDIEILYGACLGPCPNEPLLEPGLLALSADGREASGRAGDEAAIGGPPSIAYCRTLGEVPVDAEYGEAFGRLINALGGLGCELREFAPDFIDLRSLKECFNRLLFGVQAASMPAPARLGMKLAMRDISLFSLDMRKYLEAEAERAAQMARMDEALRGADLLLLPVSSTAAFSHRKSGRAIEVNGAEVKYSTATIGLTFAFNVLGNPALCLPFAKTAAGLPLGVQAVGRRYGDFDLFENVRRLYELGALRRLLLRAC
jgi:Asp-tRNAAsn/Glu-tRNAGln amidotransferase A subunit and related amidases